MDHSKPGSIVANLLAKLSVIEDLFEVTLTHRTIQRMDSADIQRDVVARHRKGESVTSIAKRYGYSTAAIYLRLKGAK
jgi:hypothetical protein